MSAPLKETTSDPLSVGAQAVDAGPTKLYTPRGSLVTKASGAPAASNAPAKLSGGPLFATGGGLFDDDKPLVQTFAPLAAAKLPVVQGSCKE